MLEPTSVIWFDGELIPWDEARVHVLAHGLHYGTGVFEGIRVYSTAEGPAAFRLEDHMKRLVGSAKAFRIPLDRTPKELSTAALELVRAVGLTECYLRPLVFYGTGSMGLNPAGAVVHTTMIAWKFGAYLGAEGLEKGVRVRVASWRRISQDSLIPNAKGTGQYLNSVMAKQEAISGGYDEAILLNSAGYVVEGSGENLFLVKDGVVTTPIATSGALEGITRETVMTLLEDQGLEIVEADVTRSDLYYADEAFLTGTAAEVTPVREIDDRPVGEGEPGDVTRMIQSLYMAVVRGEVDDYRHWLAVA
jgi:branched-chain amino acid aminotransferase